ncbi:MAG: SMP-30/gluconolactonase/LRE family protein [Pseudomonadales bacterium]
MISPELIDVIPVHNVLGEGVIWDASRGTAWWTDIEGCRIYRYQFAAKRLEQWKTPERLGCFAPVAGEDYLVAAFATGFAYFDPPSGYVQWLQRVEEDKPNTRLNDGRTDRQGRFWAGSMVESGGAGEDKGALYCLDQQRLCSSKILGLSISNGLCWSPDSAHMYHADTPNGRIDRYDFDSETVTLSNRATFAETEADSWPDGSTIDVEGYLWNAQWGGSQVVRYSPTGEVDLVLPVPASQPTCVAFGGANLSTLFVTSAKQGLGEQAVTQQPDAGNVFVYATGTKGLVESEFRPQ